MKIVINHIGLFFYLTLVMTTGYIQG